MCYALRAEPLLLRGAEDPDEAGRRTIGVPLEAPFTMGRMDEDLQTHVKIIVVKTLMTFAR